MGAKDSRVFYFLFFVKFSSAVSPLTRSGLALRLPKNTLITALSAHCLLETCADAAGLEIRGKLDTPDC